MLTGYLIYIAIAFLLFAKKPTEFGRFAGKLMSWWISPVVFLLMMAFGYFERNKMRWLRDRWALVVWKHFWEWIDNGMTDEYEKERQRRKFAQKTR